MRLMWAQLPKVCLFQKLLGIKTPSRLKTQKIELAYSISLEAFTFAPETKVIVPRHRIILSACIGNIALHSRVL